MDLTNSTKYKFNGFYNMRSNQQLQKLGDSAPIFNQMSSTRINAGNLIDLTRTILYSKSCHFLVAASCNWAFSWLRLHVNLQLPSWNFKKKCDFFYWFMHYSKRILLSISQTDSHNFISKMLLIDLPIFWNVINYQIWH